MWSVNMSALTIRSPESPHRIISWKLKFYMLAYTNCNRLLSSKYRAVSLNFSVFHDTDASSQLFTFLMYVLKFLPGYNAHILVRPLSSALPSLPLALFYHYLCCRIVVSSPNGFLNTNHIYIKLSMHAAYIL